jgi:hypothetical protein
MTIIPLDWRRVPVTAMNDSLTLEHGPDSDGLAAIGSVVEKPDGTFSVSLATNATAGIDRFVVTIDDGIRPIVLMPDPVVEYAAIDIKPGSYPNAINPLSRGVVPVAVLGSDTFDVMDIKATTVLFGPDGGSPAHNLAQPATFADHLEDVNYDGLTDLVLHYRIRETGLVPGNEQACLSGEGILPFLGCDSVLTRPKSSTP